jgi:hypothetical protein
MTPGTHWWRRRAVSSPTCHRGQDRHRLVAEANTWLALRKQPHTLKSDGQASDSRLVDA